MRLFIVGKYASLLLQMKNWGFATPSKSENFFVGGSAFSTKPSSHEKRQALAAKKARVSLVLSATSLSA